MQSEGHPGNRKRAYRSCFEMDVLAIHAHGVGNWCICVDGMPACRWNADGDTNGVLPSAHCQQG
eukprot:1154173-Pelagomonas_calceolata.AAC.3